MVNKILCATQDGLDSKVVEVEATFTRGLPAFNITGLASSSIKEAQYRVSSALVNLGFEFPALKLNINLSPSDLPKNGSQFDLPIALLIAASKECLALNEWFAFGEVGLNGDIKNVTLIYPMLLDIALKFPNAKVILPAEARELFSKIPNLEMAFASSITQALEILRGKALPTRQSKDFDFKSIEIDSKKYYFSDDFESDFSEVKNQPGAIYAALISACGFHNILFEGSPGCGKSMIAKRMQDILPPLSLTEMIESVKLQAFNEQTLEYQPKRSFRAPHQSASKASILGSASQFKVSPGEIALAHNGMIFFDELPYFKRDILESLREPLENNKLAISRVSSKIIYDTSFLFVAAMNPCPCGNLLSLTKECRCKEAEIRTYRNHLSEPFLDRIDLYIQMQEQVSESGTFKEQNSKFSNLDSKKMQDIVFCVFEKQVKRGQFDSKGRVVFNGKLNEMQVDKFCELDSNCKELLEQARTRFSLSYRGEQKVRKVARTIADMQDSTHIQKAHILEALSYRRT
ncbi:YifB family Mg chelatase-like AAA ATPase [Helicobacter saguini]|uniref:ATP-binding protein n=1 Tax=Helicobacter saguini TaxID=1548018 RepID=A0A347VNP8_9HELI|nr:YifB family Mg chelatase-like AAA ATPase [Helicobacter saguini]MWV61683.1 YifB family Mg chelatase-like AAA ATPase [Helicobacter saguini]MWV67644.1 YifB family Mg chelatase-like AAA ATPase [Helicobacter saguini]MWV69996.1 YifB family Mg chelatase-like AAA ATPase [Helicobacter saguini]MWV72790.1 YifB family Mg chelatase-like AAA ATPase [Helicobacter saguini]TLD92698.1 ATP-binding protein [Helicobacter saguini]